MKSICFVVLLTSISLIAFPQKRKAVFIIVDGIPADVIEKLPTPALDSIAGKEGFKRAIVGGERNGYSQTPTISAVGYNTVLTGTWVNKHNVWGNYGKDIDSPNYHYKNIFRLAKETARSKKIGIFSSWLDNRTKLGGESLDEAGNITFDYKYDGLELDTVTYPNDTTALRMHHIDEAVANRASSVIRQHGPDLSWIYLEYTDDMGHMYGDSPQFYDAVKTMDNQLSRVWQAVQHRQKNHNENWLVIITTDHGRDSATGKHHGGQSDRERSGWVVTNAKNLNSHYRDDSISIADIMPTIARFMKLKISPDHEREIDGVPLIGEVGATDLKANYSNEKINVTWKNKMNQGKGTIWLSVTNNFKHGKKDEYKLVSTVSLQDEHAEISVRGNGFYKVVLATPHNILNRWIVPSAN